jgi:16S rRNA (guanine527-N7)-methyltransferase
MDARRLRQLLEPFALDLTSDQTTQILAYLHLLLRWNEKINLTAIRDPEECVTRHFGESLFIARHIKLQGNLLDIGSGGGFPGLALKIAYPQVAVSLLEPVAKKRAFLKEAARVCDFRSVTVRADRLEDFARSSPPPVFDFVTMRAVGNLPVLIPLAAQCLKPDGSLLLWLTLDQLPQLAELACDIACAETFPIPLTRSGVVWIGVKQGPQAML